VFTTLNAITPASGPGDADHAAALQTLRRTILAAKRNNRVRGHERSVSPPVGQPVRLQDLVALLSVITSNSSERTGHSGATP